MTLVSSFTRSWVTIVCYFIVLGTMQAAARERGLVQGQASTGRWFIFGVLDYMGDDDTKKDWEVHLNVGAKAGGHIFIFQSATRLNTSYFISPVSSLDIQLDVELVDGTNVARSGIEIVSNTDIFVLVTVMNTVDYTEFCSYVIHPYSASSGNFFYAAAYAPLLQSSFASRVMVVAASYDTKITITDKDNVTAAFLDSMDVFQYDARDYRDLSGSSVKASKNVVVFSGSSCSGLPATRPVSVPVATQMLPPKSHRFIVPSFDKSAPLFVRVLTNKPCNVTVINKTSTFTDTIKQYKTYFLGTGPTSILTSQNVSISLYYSPFMTLTQGVDKYSNEYLFVAPALKLPSNIYTLVAIVPSDYVSSLRLDGAVFSGTTEHIVSVDDDYTIITGIVGPGFHHMENAAPFGLLLFNTYIGFFVG